MKTSVVMFCALILCMLSLAAAKALENPPPNHPPRFKRVAGGLKNLPPNHPPRFKRVAGGTPAADNKYNFVVKITRNSEKYPFCHGTIISSRWILTSGLCFNGKTPKDVLVSAGMKYKITENKSP
ncbi:chymotrypsin-like elastase family member 2A [Exaiptasia diaphana]|uniref:Peptidase S1 domain-containing protein n=1 Tax=Exaiptasia diaphana TaxID=2652724 RepID=A0A913YVH1_EXADI|nr:chymotrypsin-like elastase family member 2A [Exaiptasia diaphana]